MLDFWLWLYSKSGVGTSRLRTVIHKYQEEVGMLSIADIQNNLLGRTFEESIRKSDLKEIQHCLKENSVKIIPFWSKDYPSRLKEINDYPVFIFERGCNVDWEKPTVSIIGTRKITSYGYNVVKELLDPILGSNINVVTGLAWGVDAAVHRYMMNARCEACPVAVLAGGPLAGFPVANQRLYNQIVSKGSVISEYLPGTPIQKGMFVSRNRLAAAISDLIVVVEASEGSGSLITAQFGIDYNRDVGAVPGSIFNLQSKGNLELIKQGAIPISDGREILDILELNNDIISSKVSLRRDRLVQDIFQITGLSKKIVLELSYRLLNGPSVTFDEFEKIINKESCETRVYLTRLEVRGILRLERSGIIKLDNAY